MTNFYATNLIAFNTDSRKWLSEPFCGIPTTDPIGAIETTSTDNRKVKNNEAVLWPMVTVHLNRLRNKTKTRLVDLKIDKGPVSRRVFPERMGRFSHNQKCNPLLK